MEIEWAITETHLLKSGIVLFICYLFGELFSYVPCFADFAANFPVASVVQHEQDGLDFAEIHDAAGEDLFFAVHFSYSSDENVVVWKVNRLDQFAFHVDGALFNHGRCCQGSVECFEECGFIFVFAWC